jgi:ubiquinone/menaquinone biosynthesis C-methylase UbiE
MVEKFDPRNAWKLENPDRLVEMPPARLVELLELTGAETVVDFGAGTGMYALPIADALPQGELVAVDEQQVLLDRLREKLAARPPAGRVRIVVNQGGRVPLPDGAADRLFMINVLHHIHDDPAALADVARLIAPGGLLLTAEFARMERPVGPPNDHVLALDDLRAAVAGLGLRERAVYRPGEVGAYHNVIVAEKPPS